ASVQARASDPGLPHALGHLWRVVPQGCGEIEERPWTRRAAEVGPDLASDTVHRVAARAAFRREQALTGDWILRRAEQRLLRGGHTGSDDDHDGRQQPDPRASHAALSYPRASDNGNRADRPAASRSNDL